MTVRHCAQSAALELAAVRGPFMLQRGYSWSACVHVNAGRQSLHRLPLEAGCRQWQANELAQQALEAALHAAG